MNPIPKDGDIFAFGVKSSGNIDLSEKEGEFVSLDLTLEDRSVAAIVTTRSSEARKQGYDLIFLTCSQTCAEELKDALQAERVLFKS
jgi:hypothetical protein